MISILKWLLLFVPIFLVVSAQALTNFQDRFKHSAYVGLLGGYGSTTWGQLVPANDNEYEAMTMVTPVQVGEGGTVYGIVGGYEFMPTFALEASYQQYPSATLYFDPGSSFSFDYDGMTSFVSQTSLATVMGKFMVLFPNAPVRAFASAGVAGVHRYDVVNDIWKINPTFGFGINYVPLEHFMTELAVNYVAGYGCSELSPVEDYVPFLYSVYVTLSYRF